MVRVGRIELPTHSWQERVLPLNHTRLLFCDSTSSTHIVQVPYIMYNYIQ